MLHNDVLVQSWLRDTWLVSRRRKFFAALASSWTRPQIDGVEAWPDGAGQYRPGDYSHAAFLAIAENDE